VNEPDDIVVGVGPSFVDGAFRAEVEDRVHAVCPFRLRAELFQRLQRIITSV
jgi:hypothetical protein